MGVLGSRGEQEPNGLDRFGERFSLPSRKRYQEQGGLGQTIAAFPYKLCGAVMAGFICHLARRPSSLIPAAMEGQR